MSRFSKNVLPVLLGGDLNAYSVALAFRGAYGVTSHAFSRYKCGATANSSFIKTHVCTELADVKTAVSVLLKFAAENTGAELFLIPCSDPYLELLQRIRGQVGGLYRIDLPDMDLWKKLSDKNSFYAMIKKNGISYPEYVTVSSIDEVNEKSLSAVDYPAVLKPSDSAEYWKHPFLDMRKVYFPEDAAAAKEICERIFNSGYSKKLILQRKINNDGNRVLTTYSDNRGRVVRAVLGDVVLEERGKTSYGNYSAIITSGLDEISFELIEFLNSIKYNGFANFDIITQGREKYVLEINTRQGRSCDYLRAAGINIAELTVKNAFSEELIPDYSYREAYWHYPPHKTVISCCADKFKERINSFYDSGRAYTPYRNEYEGLIGRAYAFIHNVRLSKKTKNNV